jgi:hypothetical protein
LIFAAFPSGALASLKILPITYQSGGISFDGWTTLFTLCLAPLIAHIYAGVPKIVHLSRDKPHWRHRLGLYNPTTILWRYFAIADRRIRARHWDAAELCAVNVYFWTPQGWDGSEAMPQKSREYCVALPDDTHATFFSGSTVQTLIVTLQGANALYILTLGLVPNGAFSTSAVVSVGTVFFFLTVFGLLRLIASFWLTDDFTYVNPEDLQPDQATVIAEDPKSNASSRKTKLSEVRNHPNYGVLDIPESRIREHYMSPNSWKSWLFRVLFLLPIIGLILFCIFYLAPIGPGNSGHWLTLSEFILILFYLFFLFTSTIIYMVYFVRGQTTTTILPCVSSVWYQLYTGVLLAMTLVLIIITSIETRMTACGYYATWPSYHDYCIGVPVASDYNATQGVFGLAVVGETYNPDFNTSGVPVNQTSVVFFNGWCYNSTPITGTQDFQFVGNFTPF